MASKRSPHAPLASAEDIDQHGYAIPRDNVVNIANAANAGNAAAQQQQQSGSSGGSRGSAGSKSKPPKGEAPRLKSNSEYAQPVELPQQAVRKSKHRERRQQMAQQQGNHSSTSISIARLIKYPCFSLKQSQSQRSLVVYVIVTCPSFRECALSLFLFFIFSPPADDSDSDSESSSEEEITQNGSSSGGRKPVGGGGSSGGQKRHRKKRGVAIPVATPKVPTLPPTTAQPRPLPQTTPDVEKGKNIWSLFFETKIDNLSLFVKREGLIKDNHLEQEETFFSNLMKKHWFFFFSFFFLPFLFLFFSSSCPLPISAAGIGSYPFLPSCSDSDEEDLSDLETLQDESSRMRYQPLRSANPPRPGPPPQRGMRGTRGSGPRGGPRSHRGTARSYSSESSRHVGAGGHQLPATHTVSSPFPTPHLSTDSDVFSLQRKLIFTWTKVQYLLPTFFSVCLSVFRTLCLLNSSVFSFVKIKYLQYIQ